MTKIDFSLLKSKVNDSASLMPSIANKKILMGFWHNWPAGHGDGYQGGQFANLNLVDIPQDYNVVAVAFMKGQGIPTFKPYNLSDDEFRRQVGVLNSQGRAVLISLGGADAHIELHKGDEQPLANEIIRLVEVYGFDGLDIDLEQSAIDFADNKTVLPAALKLVKDHYKAEGKHFIISMAPEFPYLGVDGKYVGYIQALEGYYDFIAPQYYNQGGDGVWVPEYNGGTWIRQNDDELKEEFLFYLTDSLVTGTRGYIAIPADKFVIGLPANVDAANNGYVINPAAVVNAFKRLEAAGHPIKGLMTWSINWDDGLSRDNVPYNWEFYNRYAPLIHGEPGIGERPTAPANLSASDVTETGMTLSWGASAGPRPIETYTLYRNGSPINHTAALRLEDSGLTPNTQYSYFVTATDSSGKESLPSQSLSVRTAGDITDPEYPEWQLNHRYNKEDGVTYEGNRYLCLQEHVSNSGWTPPVAFTLWSKVAIKRRA
ncbi:carbohydrate-binding protein [Pseudomonas chlororaphis]|uniref:carbohydrate-binding protein n=1 Tax=Pseudomonas chlororaphis TaxID=587753 RepID=UPI000D103B9E|nr:glycosyl hydrolase family 18 protein [Pseudomonas chlororaphis]AVO60265.1 chitinase [Pseudomonas chlororaphis subsp. piscium]